MDVSALERQRLFYTERPIECHAEVARAFFAHEVKWHPGRVEATMSRLRFGEIELFFLKYGPEVEVVPQGFEDFILIYLTLTGVLSVDNAGRSLHRRAGEAILLGPQPFLKLRWAEGTRQVILKLPRTSLSATVKLPAFAVFNQIQSRQLRSLLQAMLYAVPDQEHLSDEDSWMLGLEHNLLQFLTQFLTVHSKGPASTGRRLRSAERNQRRLDRLVAYLRSHLGESITLGEMAKASALSARGLRLLCQRQLGCAPMTVLRELRLAAVRECLQRSPDAAITGIALEHGFGNLGRFAQYYRERFGELPIETQRNRSAELNQLYPI